MGQCFGPGPRPNALAYAQVLWPCPMLRGPLGPAHRARQIHCFKWPTPEKIVPAARKAHVRERGPHVRRQWPDPWGGPFGGPFPRPAVCVCVRGISRWWCATVRARPYVQALAADYTCISLSPHIQKHNIYIYIARERDSCICLYTNIYACIFVGTERVTEKATLCVCTRGEIYVYVCVCKSYACICLHAICVYRYACVCIYIYVYA